MKKLSAVEKSITGWVKEHIRLIIFGVLFGSVVYFMLMAENLMNDMDGIWHTSNFVAGNWEISLGRGLLRYFDKMRFGVVSVPFNTVLTLVVVGIANALIIDMLSIKNKLIGVLMMVAIIVNPVICFTLSYSFTTVNYGLAYLFAVAAVYVFSKYRSKIVVLIAGGLIMLSMGCYQAYIGVVGVLFVAVLIRMFIRNCDRRMIVGYVCKGISSIILGGVLYIVMTNVLLKRSGMQFASYRGASSVSVSGIITNLPESIIQCYHNFAGFFWQNKMYNTMSASKLVLIGIALVTVFCMIYQFIAIFRKNKLYALGYGITMALLPVFCNCVLIVAVGNNISLLMAMGMMLCTVVLPVILLPDEGVLAFWSKRAWCIVVVCMLWTNILTVTNDQVALKEGKTAVVKLADNIVDALYDAGYLESGYTIALVGRPSENDTFIKGAAYLNANEYAKFGNMWSAEAGNNRRSWQGVLSEYCGIRINLCPEEQYNLVIQNERIKDMPEFPLEGSIVEVDGVVVVKVSQLY